MNEYLSEIKSAPVQSSMSMSIPMPMPMPSMHQNDCLLFNARALFYKSISLYIFPKLLTPKLLINQFTSSSFWSRSLWRVRFRFNALDYRMLYSPIWSVKICNCKLRVSCWLSRANGLGARGIVC